MKKNIENLTAIIVSFLRPEYTIACIRSLKKTYPSIQFIVGENGQFDQDISDEVEKHGGEYAMMHFDAGVCIARNRVLDLVTTDYVLVGDDDFFYDKEARVDQMQTFIENHNEFSLIGGRINQGASRVLDYQGWIDFQEKHLLYRPLKVEEFPFEYDRKSKLRYAEVDITFNYFVARKSDMVKWDENIKVTFEHSDWFIAMKKAGRKMAFAPDAIVIHKQVGITVKERARYQEFRSRRNDSIYFFKKHGVEYVIGFEGKRLELHKDEQSALQSNGKVKRRYSAIRSCMIDGRIYNAGDLVITDSPNSNLRLL